MLVPCANCFPDDLSRFIGPSGMKYATNNPANSMLLCESWSGLPRSCRIRSVRDLV